MTDPIPRSEITNVEQALERALHLLDGDPREQDDPDEARRAIASALHCLRSADLEDMRVYLEKEHCQAWVRHGVRCGQRADVILYEEGYCAAHADPAQLAAEGC